MKSQLSSLAILLCLTLPPVAFASGEDPVALPSGVSADDWSQVRAAHDAGRHAPIAVAGGYQARNPGQALTAIFDGEGATVTPDGGEWTWGLELAGWGFEGGPLLTPGAAELSAQGGRVTYGWGLGLSEWWVNDTRGFEHGFTVHEQPDQGRNNGGQPLRVALGVRGDLRAVVSSDRRGVAFVDGADTARLQYAGLVALDADGVSLDAWIEATDGEIHLLVCEGSARYPLTIDPIVQQEAYIKASNTDADDQFGFSLAVSGDTLIVGARMEGSSATGINGNQADNGAMSAGAVYVFVRSGGAWTQEAYIKASNTEANDQFGSTVMISGDTLVVGAEFEDSGATGVNGDQADNNAPDSGAAYVFVRNGGAWTQEAYIKASNTGAGDLFGIGMAISGDTLIVGAPAEDSDARGINGDQADNNAPDSGAAYVFVRNGGAWAQEAYIKASNTEAGDWFGSRMAVSGGTLVVSAPWERSDATGVNGNQSNNGALTSGAAYLFVRNGGAWTQEAYIKASNSEALDFFGYPVSLSGDTLVVGASGEGSNATGINGNQANNGATSSGAVYVFVRSSGTWTQEAYIKASNTDAHDFFGSALAISGNTLVVGAWGEDSNSMGIGGGQDDNSADSAGAAYLFVRTGVVWQQRAYIKASNTDMSDVFGRALAISAERVVVGAPGEDSFATGINGNETDNGASLAGTAYVFDLHGVGSLGTAYCSSNPNSTGSQGEMSAQGSAFVADNNLTLVGLSLPTGSSGFFLTSRVQGFVPNPGGSEGDLCLGGSIGRYVGPGQVQNSGMTGQIRLLLDLTQTPTPTGFVAIQAGETWNFQAWYRDAVGGVAVSNFTDGLEITFL